MSIIPTWQKYLDKCNEILEGFGEDEFGHEFIIDVSIWIEQYEHVTPKQISGIDNIYEIYEMRGWL